jgi:hypothetical protein
MDMLAQLAVLPCLDHQPQDQAIGAANQRLGRAARPTTNPGRDKTSHTSPPHALFSSLRFLLGLGRRRGR